MKVWLEVALNGAWTKSNQPLAPYTIDQIVSEGVACANEGAAIVHVHAYDNQGKPWEDADTYTRIIEGIRSKCDVVVYPTIAFTPDDPDSEQRYAPLRQLSDRGVLEWLPIDPGSINVNSYSNIKTGLPGRSYLNPETHIRRGLEFAASRNHTPTFAVYEPGFIRLGAALAATIPQLRSPLYRFMFTDARIWGFPAEPYALDSYRSLLEREAAGAHWMIAGHEVDLTRLVAPAVAFGGHVRVGLEDAPFGTEISNLEWVKKAVLLIIAENKSPASAAEVRASCC